jgi:hypothetical protein
VLDSAFPHLVPRKTCQEAGGGVPFWHLEMMVSPVLSVRFGGAALLLVATTQDVGLQGVMYVFANTFQSPISSCLFGPCHPLAVLLGTSGGTLVRAALES